MEYASIIRIKCTMKRLHIKLNKRIKFLISIIILFLIIGLLYTAIVPKELIHTKVSNYLNQLIHHKLEIESLIKSNLKNNLIENTIIYLLTSIYLFPISLLILIGKSFTLGLSITSIIYFYSYKSIIIIIPFLITSTLNLFLISISTYYSLSYFLIKIKNKNKNKSLKKRLRKAYLKVFLITSILQILLSILQSYLFYYYFPIFH